MIGLLFFISLTGYALFYQRYLKIEMGKALLAAVSTLYLLSYLLVIVLNFYVASAYLIVGLGWLLLLGVPVWEGIRGKTVAAGLDVFRPFGSISFLIFLSLVAASAILVHGMEYFPFHDDYSFWGRASRELYVFDSFYINAESNIAHTDYHPARASLEYVITRVFGWKVEYALYEVIACFACTIAALFSGASRKKAKFAVMLTILFVMSYGMGIRTFSITTLCTDGPMALLFSATLLSWVTRRNNTPQEIFPTILAMAVLVSFKMYSGLLFSLVIAGGIAIEYISGKRKARRGDAVGHIKGWQVLLAFFLVLFVEFSWSAIYNYKTDVAQYEGQLLRAEYMDIAPSSAERPTFSLRYILKGNPRNSQMSVATFVDNFDTLRANIKRTGELLRGIRLSATPLTSVSFLSLVLIGIFAIHFSAKKEDRGRDGEAMAMLFLASILYLAGLILAMYIQPSTVSGMTRYFYVLPVAFTVFLLHLILKYIPETIAFQSWANVNALLGLAVAIALIFTHFPNTSFEYAIENKEGYPEAMRATEILNDISGNYKENDRVLIIDNLETTLTGYSGTGYAYRYSALPTRLNAAVHLYGTGTEEAASVVTNDYLRSLLRNSRANVLIVMTDDVIYREIYSALLGIQKDTPQPWVIDVYSSNGTLSYILR